jgi:hypothetical protein
MTNVKHKTCLEYKKQPIFNKDGEKIGLYRADHKEDGMVNLRNKTCLGFLHCRQVLLRRFTIPSSL